MAASAVLVLGGLSPAVALTDTWAAWTAPTGASNAYSATMRQQSLGFPEATVASDSRSNVQLASGASTFLGAGTPPGAKYGSSRNQPYLVLRPRADTATAPSTTTYTFATPTPETGWAFVLGDIDADAVRVAALDETGEPVPAARVGSWFRGAFNHAGGTDQPTWDTGTSTLTGNPAALDTDGAAGWFEPDLRLSSLTFTFTRRSGFPVYQAWFVSRARPVGGTVDDVSAVGSCPVQDSTLTLVSPYGEELATTQPAPDGSYSFGEVATQAGYTVRLDAPATCSVRGPVEVEVSTAGNDGDPASRADFDVRAIVPFPVSGTVRDDAGSPVAGVVVTLTAPGGGTTTTTTDAGGGYLFDDNPTGEGYTVSIAVPGGYRAGPDGTTIPDVDVVDGAVTGQDFVVVELPTVSGTVTGGGAGLGGVQVTLTPSGGGAPVTTVTDGDGGYSFEGVAAGTFTISVAPPPGFTGTTTRPVTVADADRPGQDFALGRPGAVGGRVTAADGSTPRPGVVVVVDGPGGTRELTTDPDGGFHAPGMTPGTWTVRVVAPAGTHVVGTASYTVTITEAGEIVGGRDFVVAADAPPVDPDPEPEPEPEPGTGGPDDTPAPGGTADVLPDTGGPDRAWALAGAGSLAAGLVLLVVSRRRSRGAVAKP